MTILRSKNVLIDGDFVPRCITIEGEMISAIYDYDSPFDLDYGESAILPGCIDLHVHINEPGRTNWERPSNMTPGLAIVDPTGLYTSFEFLRDLSNFSAGFGDTLTFGGTAWIRRNWDNQGVDRDVDNCSGIYDIGVGNTIKKNFRLNPFSTFRVYPYSKLLNY